MSIKTGDTVKVVSIVPHNGDGDESISALSRVGQQGEVIETNDYYYYSIGVRFEEQDEEGSKALYFLPEELEVLA